ncbi:MAG: NADH-quinone oxidoreductase subunit C [Bacteroidota bacterium]
MIETVVSLLGEKFSTSILKIENFRNDTTIHISKSDLQNICKFLKVDENCSFDLFIDVIGADAFTPENRFEVIYILHSLRLNHRIRIKTFIDEKDLHIETISNIWLGAEWAEREVYDMFGIIFDGHKDLRRMYMPEDFTHYPLRKDFPLMGIPNSLPLPSEPER